MNKIALFTKKYSESFLNERVLNKLEKNNLLDFYDMVPDSCHNQNIEAKNPTMSITANSMPFYMFFDDCFKKYDSIFFLSDFPLYNGNASRFIINEAHIKANDSNSIFFHSNHKKKLEQLGFNTEAISCILGDDFLKIRKEISGGAFKKIAEFVKQKLGKGLSKEKFNTIYDFIQDGESFNDFFEDESSFPYSYIGAYYKAYSLFNIFEHYGLNNKIQNFLDLGSGACLVALELLFNSVTSAFSVRSDCVDHGLKVSEKALREPFFEPFPLDYETLKSSRKKSFLVRQTYIKKIRNFLPVLVRENFQYFEQPMEEFTFSKQYDVIYVIGSLLYVSRKEIPFLLSNIMRHLNPGGLLCIHENIKNPNYIKDQEHMFEVDELEEYLKPCGSISYFHSLSGSYMKKESVGQKTVFRVIQKNDFNEEISGEENI